MGPANSIKEPMKSWAAWDRGQDFRTSLRYPRRRNGAAKGRHGQSLYRNGDGHAEAWGGRGGSSGETTLSAFHARSRTDATQSICTRSLQNSHRTPAEARPPPPSGNCNYNTELCQPDWTARVAHGLTLAQTQSSCTRTSSVTVTVTVGGNCNCKHRGRQPDWTTSVSRSQAHGARGPRHSPHQRQV